MKRFKNFLDNFFSVMRRPEMMVLPGQLAFFFVLSVVPIVTLITYGASFLHLPIDFIQDFLSKAFGGDVANLLVPFVGVSHVDFQFFFTLFVGFYIASNGAASIIISSNQIYGIRDSGFLARRIKAIIITFILVLLFIFILVVPVFGKNIVDIISSMNLNPKVMKSILFSMTLFKGPVAWFIIFFFIKIIYTIAPDRRIPSSYVNYGAIFTTILWVCGTAIYSYYIKNFANYTLFYGGLANIVMLMIWVYFLAYIFVIGMALNYREEIIKLEKTGAINLNIK